ncbi:MAG: Bax inhibitor-1/YccA family protein [Succinivibrionaceae bacterium]
MAKFESTNPVLNVDRITNSNDISVSRESTGVMTLQGTAQKSLILFGICAVVGFICASLVVSSQNQLLGGVGSFVAGILGFMCVIVSSFKSNLARFLAPTYAVCEGVFLGNLTGMVELYYPGVAIYALIATVVITGVMFTGFTLGIFKVTAKFRSFVIGCVFAICIVYLINIVMHLFGSGMGFLDATNTSLLSFVVSGVICFVAAISLLLDFDNIAQLHGNVSKDYEWVCSLGLLVTVVWLYIELLRIGVKIAIALQDRD